MKNKLTKLIPIQMTNLGMLKHREKEIIKYFQTPTAIYVQITQLFCSCTINSILFETNVCCNNIKNAS